MTRFRRRTVPFIQPLKQRFGVKGKGVVEISAKSGDEVRLSAEGSTDPDGDDFEMNWFPYPEAGSFSGAVELTSTDSLETAFIAPKVDKEETIHIILEPKDNGDPSLFSYRRAIVRVEP